MTARTEFRVWAPRAERIARARRRRRPRAGRRRPRRPRGACCRPRAGDDYCVRARRRRAARPVLALAAGRAARAVARRRPRRVRVDRRRLRAAGARRRRPLRAARRHVHARRARSTRRSRTCAALRRARRHRDRADAGRRVPGRARLGLRRRLPVAPRSRLRRARRASQRLVDAAHAAGLAVVLDVVYNHVGASGGAGARGLRPVLHRQLRDVLGRGDQLRRRAAATPCASGCCRAPRAGSATSTSTACASTRSTRSTTTAPTTSSRELAERVHARRPGALVIAESGLNDPKVMRPRERGGWGCDAAWADDFHHALRVAADRRARRLLRGVRRGRAAGQGVPPPARPRRQLLDASAAAASARPPTTSPPEQLRRLRPEPRPGRQPRARRPAARARRGRSPRSARCCRPFTPMLFMGEEYGEAAPFQFFTDHIDAEIAEATREGRRREFAALRRVRRRGGARPAGPRDVRALEAHARRASPRPARRSTRALLARAPRAAAAARSTRRLRRGRRAGCACAAASFELVVQLRRADACTCPSTAHRGRARHARRAASSDGDVVPARRWPERWSR